MRRMPPLLKGLPMSSGTSDTIRNTIDATCRQAIATAAEGFEPLTLNSTTQLA